MRLFFAVCLFASGCRFGVRGVDAGADEDLSGLDDLSGADLTGAPPPDLIGLDLTGVDLSSSDLLLPIDLAILPVLSGQMLAAPGNANLTTEGTLDWIEWGFNGTQRVQKSGGTTLGDYLATGTVNQAMNGYPTTLSWSDGAQPTSGSTTASVYTIGAGNGFTFTSAAAPGTLRTLRIYLGCYNTGTKLVAHLGDSSAADYVSTALSSSNNTPVSAVFEITYRPLTSTSLSINWNAAGLGGGGGGIVGLAAATVH